MKLLPPLLRNGRFRERLVGVEIVGDFRSVRSRKNGLQNFDPSEPSSRWVSRGRRDAAGADQSPRTNRTMLTIALTIPAISTTSFHQRAFLPGSPIRFRP